MTQVLEDLSRQQYDHLIENVHEDIGSARRLSMWGVADEVGILKTSCHEILTENLAM
jgi:hypothetical protein